MHFYFGDDIIKEFRHQVSLMTLKSMKDIELEEYIEHIKTKLLTDIYFEFDFDKKYAIKFKLEYYDDKRIEALLSDPKCICLTKEEIKELNPFDIVLILDEIKDIDKEEKFSFSIDREKFKEDYEKEKTKIEVAYDPSADKLPSLDDKIEEFKKEIYKKLEVPESLIDTHYDDSADTITYGVCSSGSATILKLADDTAYVTTTCDSLDSGSKYDEILDQMKEMQKQLDELKKKEE